MANMACPLLSQSVPAMPEAESCLHPAAHAKEAATLPSILVSTTAELELHWQATMNLVSENVHKFQISPDAIWMSYGRETKETYVALKLTASPDSLRGLPMISPHMSLAHSAKFGGWQAFWRCKHKMSMLLTTRTVSATFQTAGTTWQVLDICELHALGIMLQEIIHEHTSTWVAPNTLHITFNVIGEGTLR